MRMLFFPVIPEPVTCAVRVSRPHPPLPHPPLTLQRDPDQEEGRGPAQAGLRFEQRFGVKRGRLMWRACPGEGPGVKLQRHTLTGTQGGRESQLVPDRRSGPEGGLL